MTKDSPAEGWLGDNLALLALARLLRSSTTVHPRTFAWQCFYWATFGHLSSWAMPGHLSDVSCTCPWYRPIMVKTSLTGFPGFGLINVPRLVAFVLLPQSKRESCTVKDLAFT